MAEKIDKTIADILEETDITGMVEGGPIPIEGTLEKDGIEYVYFQDDDTKSYDDQCDTIFNLMSSNRDYQSDGTMVPQNIVIITPKNILLHGISFSGSDPQNWVKGFKKGIIEAGMLGGQIEGAKMTWTRYIELLPDTEDYVNLVSYKDIGQKFNFNLTDGTSYKLSDCEVYMPSGDGEVFDNKIEGLREVLKNRKNNN